MPDARDIVTVILLALLAGSSWTAWRNSHELDELKKTAAAEKAAAAAEHARIEREQQRIADETVQGWAAAVDYWREHGGTVVRVRPAACAGAVSALPVAAAGAPGVPAGEYRPGAPRDVDASECEARLNGSVLDAVWIETVKAWIKKQHEVGND